MSNLKCEYIPRICAVGIHNQGNMERFGLDRTLKTIWFHSLGHKHPHLSPDQVAQSASNLSLEHCQVQGIHNCSSNLCWCLTTPSVNKALLLNLSNLNPLSLSLKLFSHVLSLHAFVKSPSPCFL